MLLFVVERGLLVLYPGTTGTNFIVNKTADLNRIQLLPQISQCRGRCMQGLVTQILLMGIHSYVGRGRKAAAAARESKPGVCCIKRSVYKRTIVWSVFETDFFIQQTAAAARSPCMKMFTDIVLIVVLFLLLLRIPLRLLVACLPAPCPLFLSDPFSLLIHFTGRSVGGGH